MKRIISTLSILAFLAVTVVAMGCSADEFLGGDLSRHNGTNQVTGNGTNQVTGNGTNQATGNGTNQATGNGTNQ